MALLEVYTNGDTAFLESIFTGLGHVYADGFMGQICAIALLLNVLMSLSKFIVDKKSGFLSSFWQSIVLYLVLFSANVNVVLVTQDDTYRSIPGEFPVGIIAPASYISMIGNKIAQRMRANISAVDSGMGQTNNNAIMDFGIEPLEALLHMRSNRSVGAFDKSDTLSDPNDPGNATSGLSGAIGEYMTSCVIKAVRMTRFDPSGAKYGNSFLASNNSNSAWDNMLIDEPWAIGITLNEHRVNTTCITAHNLIKQALAERSNNIATTSVAVGATNDSESTVSERKLIVNEFLQRLDPTLPATAMAKISENMFVTALTSGQCRDSSLMGSEYVQNCTAQWDAVQERRNAEASKSDSFAEMLLPMVTFVEGFVYLISPFMMIVVLLLGSAGLKMMGKYLTALLWIVLIPVCQVAVDVYLNVYFNRWVFTSLLGDQAGSGFVSIASQESIWTELESFVAFAGTAQAMVPALSMFIIFAGVHTLQGMGSAMSNGATIDPSKLHANQSTGVKDGQTSHGQHQAVRQIDGDYARATSSTLDAGATDASFSVGGNATRSEAVKATQAASSALKTSAGQMHTEAFKNTEVVTDSHGNNITRGTAISEQAALAKSYAQTFQEQYKMDENTAMNYGAQLASKMSATGELGASIGATVGLTEALSGGSGQRGLKGTLSGGVKTGAEVAATLGRTAENKEGAGSSDSDVSTLTKLSQITKSVSDNYTTANSEGHSANKSKDLSEAESQYFSTVAEIGHQESISRDLAVANAQTTGTTVSTGKFVAETAASQSSFGHVANEQNMDVLRSQSLKNYAGLERTEATDMPLTEAQVFENRLYDKLDQGGISDLTTRQKAFLANTDKLTDSEKEHLKTVGVDVDSGEVSSAKSEMKKMAQYNYGDKEWDTYTDPGRSNDSSSRSDRQETVRNILSGMSEFTRTAGLSGEKESTLALADTWEAMSKNGIHGADDSGNHGAMKTASAALRDYGNSIADGNTEEAEILQEAAALRSDPAFDKIADIKNSAQGYVDSPNAAKNIAKSLESANGNGPLKIEAEGEKVKKEVEKRKQEVESATALTDDDKKTLQSVKAEGGKAGTMVNTTLSPEARESRISTVKSMIDEGRQDWKDKIAEVPLVGGVLGDFLDSNADFATRAAVQNEGNVGLAVDAYRAQDALQQNLSSLLKDDNFIGNQAAISGVQQLMAGNEMNKEQSIALRETVGDEKMQSIMADKATADNAMAAIEGNVGAQTALLLIDEQESTFDRGGVGSIQLFEDTSLLSAYDDRENGSLDRFRLAYEDKVDSVSGSLSEGYLEGKEAYQKDILNGQELAGHTEAVKSSMDALLNANGAVRMDQMTEKQAASVQNYIDHGKGREGADLDAAVAAFTDKNVHGDKAFSPEVAKEFLTDVSSKNGELNQFVSGLDEKELKMANALSQISSEGLAQMLQDGPENRAYEHLSGESMFGPSDPDPIAVQTGTADVADGHELLATIQGVGEARDDANAAIGGAVDNVMDSVTSFLWGDDEPKK